jgi:5-methylcytosine-specific restriction endonuclease McrA
MILKPWQLEGRVTLTPKEKREQLDRKCGEQGNRCFYCHCTLTREPDHFNTADREHVVPGKMGGCKSDADSNIVAACRSCNSAKGSKRL